MKRNRKFYSLLELLVFTVGICSFGIAYAEEAPEMGSDSTSVELSSSPVVGQSAFAELDAQAGVFSGLRLKALLVSGQTYNLGIEGMLGGSEFARAAFLPTTYGGGIRAEFYLSSGPKHAWMISPGIDGYYLPAMQVQGSQPQDIGQAIGQAIATAMVEVPTRVVVVSPNVDVNWLYQYSAHFGVVLGARVGLATAVNGENDSGQSLAGMSTPDLGLYVGARF